MQSRHHCTYYTVLHGHTLYTTYNHITKKSTVCIKWSQLYSKCLKIKHESIVPKQKRKMQTYFQTLKVNMDENQVKLDENAKIVR